MSQSLPILQPAQCWPRLQSINGVESFVLRFEQYYLPESPLLELFVMAGRDADGQLEVAVSHQVAEARDWFYATTGSGPRLDEFALAMAAPVIGLNQPVRLEPVHIAKPWGQEIWYTGIEARGQSFVTDGVHRMPLPWLLALGAEPLLREGGGEPNLLKILDPLAEEVFGDLYFELHQQKQEVYVVTGIDPLAWPDGRGAIRYGFDQGRRRAAGSDEAFRRAYLDAVLDYEAVRREIDGHLDELRASQGVPLNAPVDAQTLKGWLAQVPEALRKRELAARVAMNDFTRLQSLELGDVVKVACLTPHALQHGVRTVEFQTPVYERKILSFAQKVLTQDHWDTEEAVAMMSLESELPRDLAVLQASEDCLLEQIVRFDDFQALRLTLQPGASFSLSGDHYWIAMAIEGEVHAGALPLLPEQAVLVPRTAARCDLRNVGHQRAVCLLSMPA